MTFQLNKLLTRFLASHSFCSRQVLRTCLDDHKAAMVENTVKYVEIKNV